MRKKKKKIARKKAAASIASVVPFERGKDYRVTFAGGIATTYSGDALCQQLPFDPANVVRVVEVGFKAKAEEGKAKPEFYIAP